MATQLSDSATGFIRCAVCKIDLKGRFVYLDEEIEHLLGYTKEELFGKSFLDFLDEPSQEMIDQLLARRNHYETFYDTTTLTMFNRAQAALTTTAVVSLNFIAGNPVNFQLILNPREAANRSVQPIEPAGSLVTLIERLLRIESLSDWKEFLEILREFDGVSQASLYRIKDGKLEPRSAASEYGSMEFAFESVPDASVLHEHVARTGEEYVFVDDAAARKMVEQGVSAPPEFVARASLDDENEYLLRLVFSDEIDREQARVSIAYARMALGLVLKLMKLRDESSRSWDSSCDVKFTVGFLDALDIAAFVSDKDGYIVGYNPSLAGKFDEETLSGSFYDVIQHISAHNPPGLGKMVADYVGSAPIEDSDSDLKVSVKLSTTDSARLSVIRLGDTKEDLSACFVFVPEPLDDSRLDTGQQNDRLWWSVVRSLREPLRTARGFSEKLGHEFYNELGTGGNRYLDGLNENMDTLTGLVNDARCMCTLAARREIPEITDLNLLVNDVIQRILSSNPASSVSCTYPNLPKIRTCRRKLSAVCYNLISNSVRFNDKGSVQINIAADVADGVCVLTISDNGRGIAEEHLPHIFDFCRGRSGDKPPASPGKGTCLAITERLVRSMSGEIAVTSTQGKGTCATVTLPAE